MIHSIVCYVRLYVPPSTEFLRPATTPVFKPAYTTHSFQTRLTPLGERTLYQSHSFTSNISTIASSTTMKTTRRQLVASRATQAPVVECRLRAQHRSVKRNIIYEILVWSLLLLSLSLSITTWMCITRYYMDQKKSSPLRYIAARKT